jgi:hypothetical protein
MLSIERLFLIFSKGRQVSVSIQDLERKEYTVHDDIVPLHSLILVAPTFTHDGAMAQWRSTVGQTSVGMACSTCRAWDLKSFYL